MTEYTKYFKGKFLIAKIITTVIILVLATLKNQELISNILNMTLTIITLVLFFIIDGNLRRNE